MSGYSSTGVGCLVRLQALQRCVDLSNSRQCLWVSCGKSSVLIVIGLAADGKIHASHGVNLSGIGEV